MRRPRRTPARPSRRRRRPALALVALALVLVGCRATDDGTRVRDLDGAGEPLDEASS